MGRIFYGDVGIWPDPECARYGHGVADLHVRGDVHIDGKLHVKNGATDQKCDRLNLLEYENKVLKEKITELENKLEAIWYSPGMPGYQEARTDWNKNMEE